MIKRGHKLLAFVLAIIFVMSSGNVVKAADVEPMSIQNVSAKTFKSTSSSSAMTAVNRKIPVFNLRTGKERVDKIGDIVIYASNKAVNNQYQYKQEITLKSKGVLIYYGGTITQGGRLARFGLYYDKELTRPVDSYRIYTTSEEDKDNCVFKVPKAGKYYLGIYIPADPQSDTINSAWEVAAVAAFVSGGDRTLSNGKQIMVGCQGPQINYFKYKATQTGYVTTIGDKDSKNSVNVTLCNDMKKAYSGERSVGYNPTYGVTKGKTYYFKIESTDRRVGGYIFRVDNKKITEKSGKNKSTAVSLKKNNTVKGTIQAGSSKADWYKMKLTGKKKVNILWKGKTNDRIKVKIYKGKKAIITKTLLYNNSSVHLKSNGKLPKGTYYVKVYRGNAKSSGWYSLKWEK